MAQHDPDDPRGGHGHGHDAHSGHGHDIDHDHSGHAHDPDGGPEHGPALGAAQGTVTTVAARPATARAAAVTRARWLNVLTIGWNGVEGVVAVAAGVAAGSVSLVGFGVDSAIEVSAALILAWRLRQERGGGCMQESDRRATTWIAVSFAALSVYVAFESVRDLVERARPEASVVGLAVALLSLTVMPVLARAKKRLAPVLGSAAVVADAQQTNICAMLSAVLVVGLGANVAFGWWWADPLAGLGVAALAGMEAVRTWRAESLQDTCCA